MKQSFRQSMAWLHIWAGLLAGWVLYFVFVTGTFGYVNIEVTRWMKPERPLVARSDPASSALLVLAEARLRTKAPTSPYWSIALPGGRDGQFSISWQAPPKEVGGKGKHVREMLDTRTGEPLGVEPRQTGGGDTLYEMHYALHYMPATWAMYIVGIATMFMLVAILSGVVTHKKIFKDFFTFRPAKRQRSWLDGHNLLSVTALPFHLMITWSGLVFFIFSYMPVAVDVLYPGQKARESFYQRILGDLYAPEKVTPLPAPLAPLAPILAEAESEWGVGKVGALLVRHPGRDDARVFVGALSPIGPDGLSRGFGTLYFDGATGARLPNQRATAGPSWFNLILLHLHTGKFAGWALRLLYVAAGLAGAGMIATGLVLWSTKRKAKLAKDGMPHLGMAAVDVLNLGTIIGLPVGIATYFWANRLIPIGVDGRGEWEVHSMFIAWGLSFLYAIWRTQARAQIELAWLAAAAWGLLPLLNALTTNRHLGITNQAGDWALASIDLGMLAAGLFFAFLARVMARKQGESSGASARKASAAPVPEPAE
jgi:uncharacterized iron-regulated membrane protein